MSKEQKPNSRKNQLNDYAKYASMGFQMGAIMFLGTYGGYRLDHYFNLKIPVFTVSLALLSIVLAFYFSLKDFVRKKK
jgi:MFS-type transporter involved in bile tolerance (Atg22 family)